MQQSSPTVIVIGAGISGLVTARHLCAHGYEVTVLEAEHREGGRIQTDFVDGFLLDHGFQVYLTDYEAAGKELDLPSLKLRRFRSGAMIYHRGSFTRFVDPWRDPLNAYATAISPVGTFLDKLRIDRLRRRVEKLNIESVGIGVQPSAIERLRQEGFSDRIIEGFFRPFFGGIFLDPTLATSSGIMEFVFRCFAGGYGCLPQDGMRAIPKQIASRLPRGTLRFRSVVGGIDSGSVQLANGDCLTADAIIVATEQYAAARLLGLASPPKPRSTNCLYFDLSDLPFRGAWLVLNGEDQQPIRNLSIVSNVQPSYAPRNRHLMSVTTIGDADEHPDRLLNTVRRQLIEWYGTRASGWRHLRTYSIPHALPDQSPACIGKLSATVAPGIFRCGDYCEMGSIEGAVRSGQRCAAEIIKAFS